MVPSASAALLGVLIGLLPSAVLLAQQAPEAARAMRDRPPSLQPPDVITRDVEGRAAVRAVRVATPLRIDGRLDEPFYTSVPAMSDFTQIEPIARAPATEKTEVWVAFDDDYLYVSFRCWETRPDRMVANEMRRDSINLVLRNDNVAFMLDTFNDQRNSFLFEVNPIGGRYDGQVTGERQSNSDWNTVWDVRTARFDGGWTVETAIPFASLRYRSGPDQIWGFNVRRFNRWKNEVSYLSPVPIGAGMTGILQASAAAPIIGIEVPAAGPNLEIKPFAVADLTSDRNTVPQVTNDIGGDIGLDVKYGITQSLTADITVNTDFAQVEADTQQMNLTRFSLFFPEKREFFLENQGVFTFGGASARPLGVTPVLFYSRQIGLTQGREVPISVGGRLTGRLGAFSVGALNIQTADTDAAAATNFSVVRLKRDVLRRSSVGVLFTNRSVSASVPTGSNETLGVDGTFGFYDNLSINTYWAGTRTAGIGDDATSYRTQLDYDADRYGLQLERLVVGDDFNPEVGFVRRKAFERSFASARYSPRPQSIDAIRKLFFDGRMDYITNRAGMLESREVWSQLGIEFETSDRLDVAYTRSFERLTERFPIDPAVTIPPGGYSFHDIQAALELGSQRRFSGTLTVRHGSFFSGEKTSLDLSGGRVGLTPKFALEPSLSWNRVDLPEGHFTTGLATTRVTYTVTPLMFVSALLQFGSGADSVSTNVRLRWEYLPGSELFVVYNEQRDTLARSFPDIENRTLIVKINRLFRF